MHELAPPVTLDTARANLRALGLLDDRHRLTDHGKAAHVLGTDPRLAHTLVRATELEETHPGAIATAASVAAVLADAAPAGRPRSADLRTRVDRISGNARRQAARWRKRLDPDGTGSAVDSSLVGLIVAVAYPDRVGQRRSDGTSYLLASGAGVSLAEDDTLAREPWLAVAETSFACGGRVGSVAACTGNASMPHSSRLNLTNRLHTLAHCHVTVLTKTMCKQQHAAFTADIDSDVAC